MNMFHPSASSNTNTIMPQTISNRNRRVKGVNKVIKFLSLPEVQRINDSYTKAKFLKSKGFRNEEITEALLSTLSSTKIPDTRISLHDVGVHNLGAYNQGLLPVESSTQKNQPFSSFLKLCQKLSVFIGITTSCMYVYQLWKKFKKINDEAKKDEKDIRAELNQIKNELLKITAELRLHQAMEQTQAKLLSEVNSLKAILVSRQYFEDNPKKTFSLPSWQVNADSHSKTGNILNLDLNSSGEEESSEAVTTQSPLQEAKKDVLDGIIGMEISKVE